MGETNKKRILAITLGFAFISIFFQNCSTGFKSVSQLSSPVSASVPGSQPSPSPAPPVVTANSCPVNIAAAAPFGTYTAPSGSPSSVTLSVNAQQNQHAISRDIYGVNSYGDQTLFQELNAPVQRWGGDATSRYNWKQDSSNSGFDWYFMGGSGVATPVQNGQVDSFIKANRAASSKTILTLPMVGYLTSPDVVSATNPLGLIKDSVLTGRTISNTYTYVNSTSVTNCSFPVNIYGAQQSVNPYVTINGAQCGNSLTSSGTQITLTEAQKLANHIGIDDTWNPAWIQYLTTTYGTGANGGVQIYQLDNEPSGWANTHRDVRPIAPTPAELIQMALIQAPLIKAADSTAAVLGPSDFGYPVYGYAPQYLAAMAAYEQQHGVRILDYFDEHYYPDEASVANSPAGTAATQALRLRSTRSLWDPTYIDESWINAPVVLIPNFHSLVNANYPNTKIAITEYNFGGVESINGALAQADVLGIFGRENLDLATMWGPPTSQQPAAYSFRMYLNYDGQKSYFGDTSVQSQSSDQSQLAIYSAQRACDQSLTLMVINKTANDLVSALSLAGFTPGAHAQVYNYSSANLTQIVRQPDMPVSASGFSALYPANSITLVVIPQNQ